MARAVHRAAYIPQLTPDLDVEFGLWKRAASECLIMPLQGSRVRGCLPSFPAPVARRRGGHESCRSGPADSLARL
jgi:hypothetical protein